MKAIVFENGLSLEGRDRDHSVGGDGFLDPDFGGGGSSGTETCDDGNTVPGGCDAQCKGEPGWGCVERPTCLPILCGDGLVTGNERCDDGNAAAGDACSETCRFESGWHCGEPGEPCARARCGDGYLDGDAGEECDDGNSSTRDGCSPDCTIEGMLCGGFGN
jgi:cysteine-rich repeat protein